MVGSDEVLPKSGNIPHEGRTSTSVDFVMCQPAMVARHVSVRFGVASACVQIRFVASC